MSQSWQRFHEWMRAVAVVTFDLELGQKMEYCFPETVRLSVLGKNYSAKAKDWQRNNWSETSDAVSRFLFRKMNQESKL